MTRNDSFQCGVDFSVCGGKKKQKIMYKSAKNAGKLTLFNMYFVLQCKWGCHYCSHPAIHSRSLDVWMFFFFGYFFKIHVLIYFYNMVLLDHIFNFFISQ